MNPELIALLEKFGGGIGEASEKSDQFSAAMEGGVKNVKGFGDAFNSITDQLQSSVMSYTKEMMSGEEGVGKFGDATRKAVDAYADLLGAIVPFGAAVSFVVKIFGQLAEASLKQRDNLMKAYRDLAEMGTVAGSFEELKATLHKFGLTTAQFGELTSLLKPVTTELASFRGSLHDGSDAFADIMDSMKGDTEREMSHLGYSFSTMSQTTAEYIKQQTQLGLSQNKTNDQLKAGSIKYMETLRELEELTGLSRDELQKNREEQTKDARNALYLAELGEKNAKSLEGLQQFLDGLDKQTASDLLERLRQGGAAGTEGAIRSLNLYKNKDLMYAQQAIAGTLMDARAANQDLARTGLEQQKRFKIANAFQNDNESMSILVGKNSQQLWQLQNSGKISIDLYKRLMGISKQSGDALGNMTDLEIENRKKRLEADNMLFEVGTYVIDMFQKLTVISNFLGKMFGKFYNFIAPGLRLPKLDLSMFDDLDDINEKLVTAQQDQLDSTREVTQAQKDLTNISSKSKEEMKAEWEENHKKINEMYEKIGEAKLAAEKSNKPEDKIKADQLIEEQELLRKRNQVLSEDMKISLGGADIEKLRQKRTQALIDAQNKQTKATNDIVNLQKLQQQFGGGRLQGSKLRGEDAYKNKNYTTGKDLTPEQQRQNEAAQNDLATQSTKGDVAAVRKKLHDRKFIKGEESERGGKADDKLYFLAEKIESALGGRVTAFNDAFHQKKGPTDPHVRGKAMDYTLPAGMKTDKETINKIRDQIRSMGATRVDDEYNDPSEGATGNGHLHIEVARQGGMFSGPKSGYPMIMHGNESVWREDQMNSLLNSVEKQTIEQYQKSLLNDRKQLAEFASGKNTTNDTADTFQPVVEAINNLIERLNNNSKTTDVIKVTMPEMDNMTVALLSSLQGVSSELNSANNTLGELLSHTRI